MLQFVIEYWHMEYLALLCSMGTTTLLQLLFITLLSQKLLFIFSGVRVFFQKCVKFLGVISSVIANMYKDYHCYVDL